MLPLSVPMVPLTWIEISSGMRRNSKNLYSLFFSKIKPPSRLDNHSYWKAKSIKKFQVQLAQGRYQDNAQCTSAINPQLLAKSSKLALIS